MFSLKEIASRFGLKTNTLRYWLKKNSDDFESDFYDFNLKDLLQKVKIKKETKSKLKITRNYEQIIVLDIEEFQKEFFKYLDFTETQKQKKRMGNLCWTNSAIECYMSNMQCDNCICKDVCQKIIPINGEPPMKSTVKKLLFTLGKPPIYKMY